jgi:hypothetical protein
MYPELTNYQYASNDPILNIDVDGLEGANAVREFSYNYVKTSTLDWLPQSALKSAPKTVAQSASKAIPLLGSVVNGLVKTTATLNENKVKAHNQRQAFKVLAGDKNEIQIDRRLAERGILEVDAYMEGYNQVAQFNETILISAVGEIVFVKFIAGFFSHGLKIQKSVSQVLGKAYKASGEVTVPIKNLELLEKLNSTSKGDWVKVYEAGIQNGKKIEVHYFRNNTTKQVFEVKKKYDYWHQKSFKQL